MYITPFLYAGPFMSGEGWLATMMLAFCFYGIQETGSKLENPFGWDDIDHNLERYGMSMCLETELLYAGGEFVQSMHTVEGSLRGGTCHPADWQNVPALSVTIHYWFPPLQVAKF